MTFTYFIYTFTLLFTFLFAVLGNRLNKRWCFPYNNDPKLKLNNAYLISLVILIVIAGFRYDVGIDYFGYRDIFLGYEVDESETGTGINLLEGLEPGFMFLIDFLRKNNVGYIYLFLIMAIITWSFFFAGFVRLPYLLPLAILFLLLDGFYFWSFNGVRQAATIMMFAYVIPFIQEKKLFKYLLVIFLGSLFHYSILLLIPVYFFIDTNYIKKTFNVKTLLIVYIISIFFDALPILRDLAEQIFTFIPKYAQHEENINTILETPSSGWGILYRHITNILILFYSDKLKIFFKNSHIYINLAAIGMIFFNMVSGVQALSRFVIYFNFFKIFCLSFLFFYLYINKSTFNKILLFFLIIGYILLFYVSIFRGANGCSPYQFYFFNDL